MTKQCTKRLFAFALLSLASLVAQGPMEFARKGLIYRVWPGTLQVTVGETGKPEVTLALPSNGLGPVSKLEVDGDSATWRLPRLGVRVSAGLDKRRLEISLQCDRVQVLTWPVIPLTGVRGVVLPAFEGVYVSTADRELMRWLHQRGEMSATEGLSMPFMGLDLGGRSVTCLLPEPHYDTLEFPDDGPPVADWTHAWTKNRVGSSHTVVFAVGDGSPIAPALCYRSWLSDHGKLVTLDQKIKANPNVARLIGAPHAYLWGSAYFTRHDVPRQKWRVFAKDFLARAKADGTFVGRCAAKLSEEGRKALVEISGLQYPYSYVKTVAADALSATLLDRSLSGLAKDMSRLEVLLHNARALASEFPGVIADVSTWGAGVSTKTLDAIKAAGIDRMLLCTGDLYDSRDKPHVVEHARELGFLYGPYDSYHSIHNPDAHENSTWSTAQFDRKLYETGGVVGLDGKKRGGFKKRGYHLSPLAARPYVEKRLEGLMGLARYGAWFVDCDGYGQFFDDTHKEHPATRLDDAAARRDRLRWLSSKYGLVVGSEGASAVMASAFHFSHGVMTPVFGWGDPILKDKKSPYYLGQYWPPDEPKRFFLPVAVPPKYHRPFFTPTDRLPLYQTVFGDCLVTTHHWGGASRKFKDQIGTTELLELLYNVPPLYHLNREQWSKQEKAIVRHFQFWSPIHRALATNPLIEFRYLSKDRRVQRTTFAGPQGPVYLTANFDITKRSPELGVTINGRSIVVSGNLELTETSFSVANQ